MHTIPLRKLPAAVARAITQRAHERAISLGRAVTGLLEERLGGKGARKQRRYDDLAHLAGRWSAEEAAAIEAAIGEQRQIDVELWH